MLIKSSTGAAKFEIMDSNLELGELSVSMGQKVAVEITREDNVTVVRFEAASISDVDAVAAASGQINNFIDQNHPDELIFDFEGVQFFSSQVLGLLLDIRAKLQPHNGKVVISAINPQLHRVFKITNLDKVFDFFPDKESAIRAMSVDKETFD
jgi:anti-sigma B factor antagonist